MKYRIEDKKRNHVHTPEDMSAGLEWLKRYGRRGYVLRNATTGRILAKHAAGFQGNTYKFMKDVEVENGNGKVHELTRGAVASLRSSLGR